MTQLLQIRNIIKNFVGRFESYVKPISKFILAFMTFSIINDKVGFAEALKNTPLVIVLSLIASFLPLNAILVISVLYILLHLYSLGLASVIVFGILLFLMFLLYFRFSPRDTILLLFTPICFVLKVPYVMPLAAGLVSTPASVMSIGCGVVIYYMLSFISTNSAELVVKETSELMGKVQFIIDNMLFNKEMLVLVFAFAFCLVVVAIIRRLSVDHSWTIAIIAGTLMNIMVVLIGDLKYGTYISIPNLFFGSVVAILVVMVIKFFIFNVDYSRTEKVQYEDDEYYYYVKAVPKNNVPERTKKPEQSSSSKPVSREEAAPVRKRPVSDVQRRKVSDSAEKDRRPSQRREMTDIEKAVAAKARANRQRSVRDHK